MSALPIGWCECTMDDLSSYITSGSRDWSRFYSDEGSLFIRTQDINTNHLCHTSEIARVALPQSVEGKRTLVQRDDLLITITGANVGKCAHVQAELPEAYVSQSVALVRLVDPSLAPFLHRQLIAPSEAGGTTKLQNSAYGLGRPVLSLDNVRNTPIALPPLAEQRRIVAKLDQVMARTARARAELARIPALIAQHKQAILAAAFSNKSSTVCVRDLVSKVTAGKNLKCEERPPTDLELGVVKVSAVTWGRFDPTAAKTLPPTFDPPPHTKISRGDFLISRANTLELVGAVVIVEEVPDNLYLSDKILRLEMAPDVKSWLLWFLRSPLGRAAIEAGATGNQLSMRNLSQEALGAIELPFPDAAERNAVVGRIESAFAWLEKVAHEHAQATRLLDHLDQALLAKAFRGELVPQDPTDEPAEVLLARIRAGRGAADTAARKRKALQ